MFDAVDPIKRTRTAAAFTVFTLLSASVWDNLSKENSRSTLRRVTVRRFHPGRKKFNNTAQQSRFVSPICGWRVERTTYCRRSSSLGWTSPLQKRVSSADRKDKSRDRQLKEPQRAFGHSSTAPLADLPFQFNYRGSIETFNSKSFWSFY